MKLKMMYSFLNSDLQSIEREMEKAVQAESPLLRDASLHLLKAGGKRIRPIFVLLAAQFGEYNAEQIRKAAVSLELIHMASLVHDDVIDDADLRRGKPTIKAKWDNKIAMYTGDYIFARSTEIMCDIPNIEAHRILANTIVEVCIGEIQQMRDKYRFNQNIKDYFRRIKRKTALLISASTQIGAIVSNADAQTIRSLYYFGHYVGMSYQIMDDVLDFVGTEKQLGKPAGGDLLQGNITLPALFAMENDYFRHEIEKVHEDMDKKQLDVIISHIKESDAIERSLQISNHYLTKALHTIEVLPNNQAKKALISIAQYLGKRKF